MSVTTGTFPGVRIVDMPDLGTVTDNSSLVGEHAGSGRFSAPALRAYALSGGTVSGPLNVIATGGSVARSVQDHFGEVANVRDFGALGDGLTDDTAAVQAAVNEALSSRKACYAPAGNYKLTGPITVGLPASGFKLFGDGQDVTRFTPTSNTANVFNITSGSQNHVEICDFSVAYTALTQTSGAIFNVTMCGGLNFHDIYTFGGWNVLALSGTTLSQVFTVNKVNFVEFLQNGISIALDGAGSTAGEPGGLGFFNEIFLDTYSANTGNGVLILAGQSLSFNLLQLQGMQNPILLDCNAGAIITDCTWTNCYADNIARGETGGAGWSIYNGLGVTQRQFLTGCWAGTCGGAGFSIQACQVSLSNCISICNAGHGIELQSGCSDITISGCEVTANSFAAHNVNNGIDVTGTCDNIVITGNRIGTTSDQATPTQKYGISIEGGGSDYYVISHNVLFGNLTGALIDFASGTHKFINNNPGAPGGTVYVRGVTDGSNAGTGSVGEYVAANRAFGAAVTLTNLTPADIVSISLTAGDWDISGNILCKTTTTGFQFAVASIGTVSSTIEPAPNGGGYANVLVNSLANSEIATTVGPVRLSLTTSAVVYLCVEAGFTGTTVTVCGFVAARRAR